MTGFYRILRLLALLAVLAALAFLVIDQKQRGSAEEPPVEEVAVEAPTPEPRVRGPRRQAPKPEALPGAPQTPAFPEQKPTSSAEVVVKPPTPSELTQKYAPALMLIEGDQGSGSGFIIDHHGASVLMTNAHVLSGNQTFKARPINGKSVSFKAMQVATNADLVRVMTQEEFPKIPVSTNVDSEVNIGDAVIVLGNSSGAGVITHLEGTVQGVGPDLLEVSAPFVPGNSGSPVIHVKSGKVVAVATFIMVYQDNQIGNASSTTKTERRFAYRIDTVKDWKTVAWPQFVKEGEQVKALEERMDSYRKLAVGLGSLSKDNYTTFLKPNTSLHRTLLEYGDRMSRSRQAEAYYQTETKRFLERITRELDRDPLLQTHQQFSDFHRREASRLLEIRTPLREYFQTVRGVFRN